MNEPLSDQRNSLSSRKTDKKTDGESKNSENFPKTTRFNFNKLQPFVFKIM